MAKRNGKSQEVAVEKVSQSSTSDIVTYHAFFHECAAKGLVKPWQEKEIQVFFRGLGLTDKESSDKYKDALAKY